MRSLPVISVTLGGHSTEPYTAQGLRDDDQNHRRRTKHGHDLIKSSLRSSSCLGRKPPRAPQLEETPDKNTALFKRSPFITYAILGTVDSLIRERGAVP